MKRILVAGVVLALAITACSSKENPTVTGTPNGPEKQMIGGQDVVVRGRLTVSGNAATLAIKDNFFEPNILIGAAGSRVTLTLQSAGLGIHNFSLTEQSINKDITPGSTSTVDVTFPPSGRLVFFCRFHRDESGMIGALDAA